jgi:hypothetical protein
MSQIDWLSRLNFEPNVLPSTVVKYARPCEVTVTFFFNLIVHSVVAGFTLGSETLYKINTACCLL